MNETRNWRDAKPKWVVDAAEADMAAMQRRLALRWPDEARPIPVGFGWGGYDHQHGIPTPGEYYVPGQFGKAQKVFIRAKAETDRGWKQWRFSSDGERWTEHVVRGALYTTEREAKLAALWSACDKAANDLEPIWKSFTDDRGFL